MTNDELLRNLYDDLQMMKTDMQEMRTNMQTMHTDMQEMHTNMQTMHTDMQMMKTDLVSVKNDTEEIRSRVSNLELRLENETNRNIRLLAENHIELINKLNEAIKVSSRHYLYELKVNTLERRVENLERYQMPS